MWAGSELQALVYILSPTTAITDYAIGLRKLSAKRQFFINAKKKIKKIGSKIVTDDSDYIRPPALLTPAQTKTKIV